MILRLFKILESYNILRNVNGICINVNYFQFRSWCIPPLYLSPSGRYSATTLTVYSCVPIICFCFFFFFVQVKYSDSYNRAGNTSLSKKYIVRRFTVLLKGHGCKLQFDNNVIKSQGSPSKRKRRYKKKILYEFLKSL